MSATIALSDRGFSPTRHANGHAREDHSMSFPLEQDKTLQNGNHTSRGGGKPHMMGLQDSMPNGHAEPARRPSSPGSELDTVTAELGDTISLNQLQTESCDAAWAERIDTLGTADLCAEFINHESSVLPAITAALPVISALVDALVKRLQAGGRVFYVGAGNSGRVASMDCSEMGPTFSVDPSQFIALVAGGSRAVMQAREDAEDSESNGAAALEAMQPKAQDAIIGISASGRTPFVLGALRAARNAGALTAGITNCQPSGFGRLGVQYLVKALTGPEFIAGSTRLKAGTAAKQILNMVSTITMVHLGKTYRGLMLDVRVRNHKLRVRGRRILRQVCGGGPAYLLGKVETYSTGRSSLSTPQDVKSIQIPHLVDLSSPSADAAIDSHIQLCQANVKLACAVAVSGLDLAAALERLERINGRFYEFLALSQPSPLLLPSQNDELVLAIDGGGTNCKVAVATRSGQIAHGEAGACNITCATPDELVTQIRTATLSALTNLRNNQTGPSTQNKQQCLVPETDVPRFSRVWAGISGLHYSYNPAALAYRLETLLSVSVRDGSLRMTSDAPLLGACVGVDDSVQGGLCVIAGTGSVAVAVRKRPDGSVDQVSRAGGWGHLLGDDGSAFDIGRRALQAVLADMALLADEAGLFGEDLPDQGHASDEASGLEKAVLAALGTNDPAQLLPLILYNADREPKHQIAEVARVVTALAFPDDDDAAPDTQALGILQDAASSLVVSIKRLATSRLCTPSSDMLILSGAMLNLAPYRALFLDAWERQGLPAFRKTIVVKSASEWATRFLLRQTAS
ncbi:N-acetylmuramic acid 6-phosphate etherase [Sporothrix schenckii 1099-18]|uniref:N-acetyl-D-glucosamine kinase n=1 Tax=Sporothrix schenckii 1099-18 TaxID=1397361 RepID=A0A0F2LXM0_SPOSC|nr:N-acetylmuramic acid 6-phosphate etherase [Sporothrix schenckii 1099-18]KJR82212.1 N-acetylmuramic acid 6-phosphate etherase [Sporothrix schenckii 1099-18]